MSSPNANTADMTAPVRVIQTSESGAAWQRRVLFLLLLAVLLLAFWMWPRPAAEGAAQAAALASNPPLGQPADPSQQPRPVQALTALPRAMRPVASATPAPTDLPELDLQSHDPNDLATYFKPGDAVPDTGELIKALNDAGIHEGIAAFNPPGTSPPMMGLRVPENFALPPGYVRHHQVTDQGEPIDPILMFAPDFEFFDERGRPVAIPENRVVPPELAPPGLPLEPISIPDP